MPEESGKCTACSGWFKKPSTIVYINFFLSSWGDRMWHFAIGLFLVHFDGGQLRLAAIRGFIQGALIMLLGGVIGRWVDKNPRLKVVRASLFIQNMSVMLSAVAVCIHIGFEDGMTEAHRYVCQTFIIILAILAELASVAYKISIEKDWIIIVAEGKKGRLANLNAVIRSMDLMCKVLAPTVAGQVMTYGSLLIAALLIAGWNLVSVFIEFGLLYYVYIKVPRLHYKEGQKGDPNLDPEKAEEKEMMEIKAPEKEENKQDSDENNAKETEALKSDNNKTTNAVNNSQRKPRTRRRTMSISEKSCMELMIDPFMILFKGWRVYARQRVVFAGVALGFLYMTVLGFDSITLGYIYSQGITESIVGVACALAGFTGIIGTFTFTQARKRIGLERTGLFSFSAEIACLTLTVASIWAPGSPFDLDWANKPPKPNCTAALEATAVPPILATTVLPPVLINDTAGRIKRDLMEQNLNTHLLYRRASGNDTAAGDGNPSYVVDGNGTDTGVPGCEPQKFVYTSVIMFLVGIVTSRVGLWMSDLVVTQLLQENVIESERGVVNGVQNSLNMLMDILKFVMVLVAPRIETFGILILMSFGFICVGGMSFAYHSYRVRGHLLPHCYRKRGEQPSVNNTLGKVEVELDDPEEKEKLSEA